MSRLDSIYSMGYTFWGNDVDKFPNEVDKVHRRFRNNNFPFFFCRVNGASFVLWKLRKFSWNTINGNIRQVQCQIFPSVWFVRPKSLEGKLPGWFGVHRFRGVEGRGPQENPVCELGLKTRDGKPAEKPESSKTREAKASSGANAVRREDGDRRAEEIARSEEPKQTHSPLLLHLFAPGISPFLEAVATSTTEPSHPRPATTAKRTLFRAPYSRKRAK